MKAKFRRGMACVGLEEYREAKHDLEEVASVDNGNQVAIKALKVVRMKCKELDNEQKKIFKGAFKEQIIKESLEEKEKSLKGNFKADKSADASQSSTTTTPSLNQEQDRVTSDNNHIKSSSSSTPSSAQVVIKKKGLLLYDDKPSVKPSKKLNNNDSNKDTYMNGKGKVTEEEEEEDSTMVKRDITIPAGLEPGDEFSYSLSDGYSANVTVPKGAKGGDKVCSLKERN
jgi:hypothetical protein